MSPLYSEHIYKVQSVNKTSNTYIIVRIGTEISGTRTKRFLYHRRRLKKIRMPSETLRKFWMDFPNSLNPLQLLEKAVTDGAFEHNDQDTDQQPVQADQQPEQQAYQQNEVRNLTTTQQSAGNEVIPNQSRNLRDRKVANYNNLQKLRP